MARVFVSYRRADGQYGVGWLAERLRSLDSITGVETAFHDSALRAGDDFPDALDQEIAGSDLVIAVIGPEWLGEQADRGARIKDADDWVVREIAAAFQLDTRVLPVLIGSAEHPLASQVHESIAEIARLHALPFNDGRDLDTIIEHVESHLDEIDRERARRAGLEEPVVVPRLPRLPLVASLAALAGIVFGILAPTGWAADPCAGPCSPGGITETSAFGGLLVTSSLFGALAGATTVVGLVMVRRLAVVVAHRWAPIATIVGVALISIVLITISMPDGLYGIVSAETIADGRTRFWSGLIGTCVPVAVWAVGGLSPRFGVPRAAPYRIAERVRTLGIVRDAERWAVVCLTGVTTFVAANSAFMALALQQAADETDIDPSPIPNIAHSLFLVVLTVSLHLTSVPKLRQMQVDIERELEGLPPRYRENAAPRLIATTFDDGGWGFRLVLVLPVVVAIVGAIVLVTTG